SEAVDLCGARVQVGASIGIAVQAPGSAPTPEELIKEADRWMYEAKKSGRGCVLPLPSPA
ncbi:diguanylate cyclase, partial [Acinetobacter baumannii]|nr:diguanylate cyclase [Acinetobacter baumannii]